MVLTKQDFIIKAGILVAATAVSSLRWSNALNPDGAAVFHLGSLLPAVIFVPLAALIPGALLWGIVALTIKRRTRDHTLACFLMGLWVVALWMLCSKEFQVADMSPPSATGGGVFYWFLAYVFAFIYSLPEEGWTRTQDKTTDWHAMQLHLCEQGNWSGLKKLAMDWLTAERGNFAPWYVLGLAQIHLGEHADAVQSYEKAVVLGPKDPQCWYGLGVASENVGNFERARAAYTAVLKHDAKYPETRNALYRVEVALEKQQSTAANQGADWRPICREHARTKNWRALERAAYQWLEHEPKNATARFSLGLALLNTGDHKNSVWWFKSALEQESDNPTYWYHVALSLVTLGRISEAVSALKNATRLRANFREAAKLLEQLAGSQEGERASSYETPSPSKDHQSYLEVLELRHGASASEIKAAYRRLMQQYHPDRVAHLGKELRELAERKAKEINEAYDALLRTQQS